MTKVGDLNKVNGVKDETMELTKDEAKELINVLTDVLTLNDFILKNCFQDSCDSLDRDEFFDAVHTDALDTGVRTVTCLGEILAKPPYIRLNDEGMRMFKRWLIVRDSYDPDDKYAN